MTYIYKGDRMTDQTLKGATCEAIRNESGKCITRGSKMLVRFEKGNHVVLRRLLRKSIDK